MNQLLDGKNTKINILTMIINKIPGCEIKSPGTELDSFLMDPDAIKAFVLSFTSLSYEESHLQKILEASENYKSGSTSCTPEQEPITEDTWYKSRRACTPPSLSLIMHLRTK